MKNIKKILGSALLVLGVGLLFVPATSQAKVTIDDANAENHKVACDKNGGTVDGSGNCSEGGSDIASIFRAVTNTMLFLVGAVAVIMLIVGGFRYVTSNGDQNSVTAAKNTIMYALIGIVVAFLAFAAVNFVTNQLENANTSGESGYIQQASILV